MQKSKELVYNVVKIFLILWLLVWCGALSSQLWAQEGFTIARVKYSGGGDWYNDPSIIPNLLKFIHQEVGIPVAKDEARVSLTDEALFSYPIIFLTGHGRIKFSDLEVKRLRHYLTHGGFLYVDDDYGMDKYFRREIKKVFPENKLVELPFSHGIYHSHFDFPNGLPKIHEHEGGPPHGYGIFHDGNLVLYYTFSTNISDGWADPDVHHDPAPIRQAALRMGVNIVVWALMN